MEKKNFITIYCKKSFAAILFSLSFSDLSQAYKILANKHISEALV